MLPKNKFLSRCFFFVLCGSTAIFLLYKLPESINLLSVVPNSEVYYDEYNCGCPRYSQSIRELEESSFCSDGSTSRGKNQNVVSYTIFGDYENKKLRERYYDQIEHRLKEVDMYYNGWIVRLYHNFSQHDDFAMKLICNLYCNYSHFDPCNVSKIEVPKTWLEELNSATKFEPNEKIKKIKNGENIFGNLLPGTVWRFLPLGDSFVSSFIVRDVDSFILEREVAAVKEWLDYRTLIHVMRDNPTHTVIMLAGMWGALRTKDEGKLTNFLKEMVFTPIKEIWDFDQVLLRTIVWPKVTNEIVIHDSYHCRSFTLTKDGNIVLPYPTQRQGKLFISWGPTRNFIEFDQIKICPPACRPKNHQNWKYC